MSEDSGQQENQAAVAELVSIDSASASSSLAMARLRGLTSARVGLRRAGIGIASSELLEFQLAHARARDAVHAALQPAALLAELKTLSSRDTLLLHSAAPDRTRYLQRPDLGRRLDDASRKRLHAFRSATNEQAYDLAIVVVDGLSSLAVDRHASPLVAELIRAIAASGMTVELAPICVVEQGRVALGDEVADALAAELVIVLIGERPGLSSPDSLGAYITWKPRPGVTTDAERNCISNIRTEGLSYAEGAARLLHYLSEARSKGITGIALKDPVILAPLSISDSVDVPKATKSLGE